MAVPRQDEVRREGVERCAVAFGKFGFPMVKAQRTHNVCIDLHGQRQCVDKPKSLLAVDVVRRVHRLLDRDHVGRALGQWISTRVGGVSAQLRLGVAALRQHTKHHPLRLSIQHLLRRDQA